MKLYDSKYKISYYNWAMIQLSGFDFKYLMKYPRKTTKKQKIKLYNTYMQIFESLENTNSKILTAYVKWQALFRKFAALKAVKSKMNVDNLEPEFRAYLESLQEFYNEFTIKEYKLHPNYKALLKEKLPNLNDDSYKLMFSELKKLKGFYTWDQYEFFRHSNPVTSYLLKLEWFKNNIIISEDITINNIIDLDVHLYDIYESFNAYDQYQYIRLILFDITSLKMTSEKNSDSFDELAAISDILGYNLNPKEISLAEFESREKQAKSKLERIKNKPQADNGRL
jgi:hypothetical protein